MVSGKCGFANQINTHFAAAGIVMEGYWINRNFTSYLRKHLRNNGFRVGTVGKVDEVGETLADGEILVKDPMS
jgi:hypothetical protein